MGTIGRLDFFLGVIVIAASIIVAGLLFSPTVTVTPGGFGVSQRLIAADSKPAVTPVKIIGINLPSYTQPLKVMVVK